MNSLKIARGTDGRITTISRHVTRNDILKGLTLGIGLLVLAGVLFGWPQHQSPSLLVLPLLTCGLGIYMVCGCINRLFTPSSRDIRIADASGLIFSRYNTMKTVPWSDISGYHREPAPHRGMGKELLVVQLADSEKYLARERGTLGADDQLPGGKRALPFATLASSSLLDLGELENAMGQFLAQHNITPASLSPPHVAGSAPSPIADAAPSQKSPLEKYLPVLAIAGGIFAALVYGVLMVRSGHRTNFAMPLLITILSGMAGRFVTAKLRKVRTR
jgi:hypothetical protein